VAVLLAAMVSPDAHANVLHSTVTFEIEEGFGHTTHDEATTIPPICLAEGAHSLATTRCTGEKVVITRGGLSRLSELLPPSSDAGALGSCAWDPEGSQGATRKLRRNRELPV